jgi:hypothetical protein
VHSAENHRLVAKNRSKHCYPPQSWMHPKVSALTSQVLY